MPDISMCLASECPKKLECARYIVKPNPYRQSYGTFVYTEEGCVHFAQATDGEKEAYNINAGEEAPA